jgi:hypothetical protein
MTPRCIQMLENRTQCNNDSATPSQYCKLHIALAEGLKVAADQAKLKADENAS